MSKLLHFSERSLNLFFQTLAYVTFVYLTQPNIHRMFTEEQIRLIFGLKLKQIRNDKGLSLFGLAKLTGLSKSYLNEIEKGKKYPKPDKIVSLSTALGVPYDELVSMKLGGPMAPVSDIIMSGVLKEIPLELFGINEGQLLDIISSAPEKVTSFVSTIFEMARHYQIDRNQFYLNALRSYQEQHFNYFEEIEKEVVKSARKYQIDTASHLSSVELAEILCEEFGYTIDTEELNRDEYPERIRSVFIPKSKKLLIAKTVTEAQKTFILAKELGYAHMGITHRPLTFTWISFEHFDEVLNNFRASYFAGALTLPEKPLVKSVKQILSKPKFTAEELLNTLCEYTESAETFFQRLTNILPHHFGLTDMFFLRFASSHSHHTPIITKEFHLSKSHQPHAHHKREHYCSRWVSTDIINNPENYPLKNGVRAGVQLSKYPNDDTYLILAASNEDPFRKGESRSVCIGIEINDSQKKKVPIIQNLPEAKNVGITCERCPISDCQERKSPATVLDKQMKLEQLESRVNELIQKG